MTIDVKIRKKCFKKITACNSMVCCGKKGNPWFQDPKKKKGKNSKILYDDMALYSTSYSMSWF